MIQNLAQLINFLIILIHHKIIVILRSPHQSPPSPPPQKKKKLKNGEAPPNPPPPPPKKKKKKACTCAIKTIYKYCLKYVQILRISCESKGNYIVDHAANFKQQIVDARLECLNTKRNLLQNRAITKRIRKPLNACNK